jgi:hypothetical protein
MTKTFLCIGDTHGDIAFATRAIEHARQYGAEVVQLGDWGFIFGNTSQVKQLSAVLVAYDVTMRFCDGNHDDHPRLRKYVSACVATTIAPRVIYQPRGSVYEDADGTRFLFCGGAPSIDRAYRTTGQSWWPEEVITKAELDIALAVPGPIHVLVTHDAPSLPPGFAPKGSPHYRREQELSMQYVAALIKKHRPSLHVHGHWHRHLDRMEFGTRSIGLDCNNARFEDAVLLWSRTNDPDPDPVAAVAAEQP